MAAAVSTSYLVASSTATLGPGCTFDAASGTATCAFASIGSEQTFTVPAGVTSLHVVAKGAPGAAGFVGAPGDGGRGAAVTGDLRVASNEVLYLEVGGAPTTSQTCTNVFVPTAQPCVGGFNGGGSSLGSNSAGWAYGGGGGGASDIRTLTRTDPDTFASRLIVAGGGGGGGGSPYYYGTTGAGGDAGSPGTAAADITYPSDPPITAHGGTGGGAGSDIAGGAAGDPGGLSGSQGSGGDAGDGGGGGGGRFGGGSGGDDGYLATAVAHLPAGGGGGGGGSNLVPPGGSSALTSDPPQITISYALGKEQCRNGGWQSFGVFKNQGDCVSSAAGKG